MKDTVDRWPMLYHPVESVPMSQVPNTEVDEEPLIHPARHDAPPTREPWVKPVITVLPRLTEIVLQTGGGIGGGGRGGGTVF